MTADRATHVSWGLQAVLIAAPLVIGLATKDNFIHDSLTQVLLFAILALSWNILGGFARQVSVGHVAFFGIGAYTSTILALDFGLSPWIGMIVGGLIAAIAGGLLGLVTFRLRGTFFTMATLAFAEVMRILAVNLRGITKGSEGITIDSTPNLSMYVLGDLRSYVVVGFILMLALFLLSVLLARSKVGLKLLAYREEEEAARALGVRTVRLRLLVMVLSAFCTALGGTFYAQYLLFIDPDSVLSIELSLQMALLSVVGGVGTAIGPILGTYLVVPFGQILRAQLGSELAGLHLVIYGLGLILVLYKMPNGVWPAIEGFLNRKFSSGKDSAEERPVVEKRA
jgi:branched-chain amino acid transport system permease protein